MEVVKVLKLIICLSLLCQQQTVDGKQHFSGAMGLQDQQQKMGRKLAGGKETVPWWWTEDYSVAHRRRPVHNKLDP
ncbi:hypothetical protein L1049_002140 [Liquidambar formosana]|uniref:Uncharacterized protein n=1 Tax=Liquidambar formosana TaxID=63359 RepID=A0AAP0NGK5_LIQFO